MGSVNVFEPEIFVCPQIFEDSATAMYIHVSDNGRLLFGNLSFLVEYTCISEILVHVAILKEIVHKSDRFWGLFRLKSSNLTKPWQICQILWSYLADFEKISVRFHRTHTYFHSCNA